MLVGKADIEDYIPQRKPMVMIHELTEATDERAVSKLVIEEDNIFVAKGLLTEPGLIENIAQTAAAQVGYRCRQQGIPVPVGFIAAIKDLKVSGLPVLHTAIKTGVVVTNRIFDVTLIRGTVEQDGEILCSCEMKIFIKP